MWIRTFFSLASVTSCLLTAAPSVALEDMDEIIRVAVVDGGLSSDGTHIGALRMVLAPGWKTYWRAPGDAGIPPTFSFAGSDNVASVGIIWPTPEVFDQNGMSSIGYENELVLPLQITPKEVGAPVHLSGDVAFGICRDVCIPGHLTFDGKLTPEAKRSPAIAAALASRPYSAREAGVTRSACRISPAEHGLTLTATIQMPSAGGAETVVFEPSDPQVWAGHAETSRSGNTLTATADLVHPYDAFAFDRSNLRITVLGQAHAVDIRGCEAE